MCDNCYHRSVCNSYLSAHIAGVQIDDTKCPYFKDKELIIKLPCKIGGTLYMISTRVDGKPHIRRITLTNQNMGNVLSRIGDDIYADLESAEKAMEAMK